jgi:hypothetical protein
MYGVGFSTAIQVPFHGTYKTAKALAFKFKFFKCLKVSLFARQRQSRPDSGLGFAVQALQTFQVVPSWFGTPHTMYSLASQLPSSFQS